MALSAGKANPSATGTRTSRAIRTGGRQGLAGPALAAVYTLGTWGAPHRPTMLAVAVTSMTISGLLWWRADAVARWRIRTAVRWFASLISLACLTVLTALGGGVAGPLGALLPISLIFFALITPPRQFVVIASAGFAAYWAVALFGAPAPPGYPLVYTLAFIGLSYLCLSHAGALVSLRRRLATVSRNDPLTHCLNRRGFEERMRARMAEARRTGQPFTLILADLDAFKSVNDTYGHQAGDELLAWTARTVAEIVGDRGAVGRVGGDEFAVILDDTGPERAADVAGRLRAALDGVAPASVGCASYPADGDDLAGLVHLADARTYDDKVSRPHTPPTAAAVQIARQGTVRRTGVQVSRHERRRRSITDMGRVGMTNFAVGLLYSVAFVPDSPRRMLLLLLNALGCAGGITLVAAAGRLSRSAGALRFLISSALIIFPLGVLVAAVDGGAGSALALGTLIPMPLIALGAPARVAVPVLAGVGGLYVGLGMFGGAPSGWYVATNLAGIIGASVVCAAQGSAAARQRSLLTRLSRVDVLTELLNRRGFEEQFAQALAGARRPLSLLIFDLDGFKQLNDSHGHVAGDELLRWTAATLRANLRRDDVVGRHGGDEFVVLLVDSSAEESRATADRLRQALAVRTGVCAGVAVLGEHGDDFDSLYAHADAGLYAQKSARGSRRSRTPTGPPRMVAGTP
jgi:diguanylate cyclase (GGDEF)-like protein